MKLSYKYHTFNVPLWLLRLLKRRMRYVRAAGGIVSAPDCEGSASGSSDSEAENKMLLILRNGRWDLAKGKVEAGETLLQAALREVEEETGIAPAASGTTPVKTYHIFNLYGGWHLKQTSWFPMTAAGNPVPTPQQEEGITDAVWVSPDEWHRRLQTSYGTLKTLSDQWKHSRR